MRDVAAYAAVACVAAGLYVAGLGAPFMTVAVTFSAIACVRGAHAQPQ